MKLTPRCCVCFSAPAAEGRKRCPDCEPGAGITTTAQRQQRYAAIAAQLNPKENQP